MDVDLKEHLFDPTMSVVTRTSTARVPEGARQAPHSSQFSSTDWQIIGKTNANTENTQILKKCSAFVLTKCRYKYKSAVRRYICHTFHQQLVTGQQFAKQKG